MTKRHILCLTAALMAVFSVQAGIVSNLVADASFEGLAVLNEPNNNTAPWFSIGEGSVPDFNLQWELSIVNSGVQAVAFQYYGPTFSLAQNVSNTVQAGKSYEIDLWHAIGEPTGNAAFSNAMSYTVAMYTSTTLASGYSLAASFSGVTSSQPDGVYENYTATFDAASLIGVVGEYIQIRFLKDIPNTSKRLFLDDISFGVSDVAVPATLATDPSDELVIDNIQGVSAVVTGELAVAYIEGDPPTNVTITAVSIVDQTNPGGFSSLTSLPLTLAAPSPDSDTLLIEYDNGTGGLLEGETATGVVEIVWNEVGSATSATSSVPVRVTIPQVNEDNIVAVWYGESVSPNIALQPLQATRSGGRSPYNNQRSTDGTYGTLSNAPTDGSAWNCANGDTNLFYAITNNTGADITFDSLHFDIARQYAKGPDAVIVSISGDVTDTPTLTNHVGFTQFPGTFGDYDDFDVDLTGLADRTIAQGEAILITFNFYNGDFSNPNAVSTIDNIALLGDGLNGAALTKVPGGQINLGVSGLDLGASELIEMFFTQGDAKTNVVITGVSITNETYPGAFSTSGGSFPQTLATAGETNEIVTVEFDNTVAKLEAGTNAYATVQIAWNEAGLGTRVFDIDVYAIRPAVPTNGVIALFDTTFTVPDAAVNGVLGSFTDGQGIRSDLGSNDGSYGSLTNPAAPTVVNAYSAYNHTNSTMTLTVTNQTVANITLSSISFDVGRVWLNSSEDFTLSVSGDVDNTILTNYVGLTQIGSVGDADDFDVDLTGLTDNVLAAGESVVFTFSLVQKTIVLFLPTFVDNVALLGSVDAYGGWAETEGLTGANNLPGDNPDGDNKDNLLEFSSGGDPLVADGTASSSWLAADGGTNWLYFVHLERQDDPNLSYGAVGTKADLVFTPTWDANDAELVGASSGPGLFIAVTNRTEVTGTEKFIGVPIQKD